MSTINFNYLGESMGFNEKIKKHIADRNPEKLKDYLTHAFDNINPYYPEEHPCLLTIKAAEKVMWELGWKCGFYNWGDDKGLQYTCVSPDNRWYRSHYTY